MTGSLNDFLKLEEALRSFHVAEDNSRAFFTRWAAENERQRIKELTQQAVICGFDITGPEGPVAWSERMIRRFNMIFGRAA